MKKIYIILLFFLISCSTQKELRQERFVYIKIKDPYTGKILILKVNKDNMIKHLENSK